MNLLLDLVLFLDPSSFTHYGPVTQVLFMEESDGGVDLLSSGKVQFIPAIIVFSTPSFFL